MLQPKGMNALLHLPAASYAIAKCSVTIISIICYILQYLHVYCQDHLKRSLVFPVSLAFHPAVFGTAG